MFDLIFDVFSAWSQIMLFVMAFVFILIGACILGYEIYKRRKGIRVKAKVVGISMKEVSANQQDHHHSISTDNKKLGLGSILFLGLFMLVPLIFVFFGAQQGYRYLSLSKSGVYAEATVIRNDSSYDSEGGTSYKAVLEFYDSSNKRREVKDGISYGSSPSFSKGTKIGVFYDEKDPESFVIDDFWHNVTFSLIFMAFGLGFVGILLLCAYLAKTQGHRPEGKGLGRKERMKEVYSPIVEYHLPKGEVVEAVLDKEDTMMLSFMPGKLSNLLIMPDNSEQPRSSSFAYIIFGCVFILPGLYIASVAFAQGIQFMTVALLAVFLCFIVFKIWMFVQKIPKKEWDDGWKKYKEEGLKITSSSSSRYTNIKNIHRLEPHEIKKRIPKAVKTLKIWMCVIGVLAAGLLTGAYYAGENMRSRIENGAYTSGKIIDFKQKRSDDSYTYSAVIKFNDVNGDKYKFTDSVGSSHPTLKQGDEVSVLYMVDDPSNAIVDRGILNWMLSAGLCSGAVLFLWLCLHYWRLIRRYGSSGYQGRV